MFSQYLIGIMYEYILGLPILQFTKKQRYESNYNTFAVLFKLQSDVIGNYRYVSSVLVNHAILNSNLYEFTRICTKSLKHTFTQSHITRPIV